MNLGSALYVGSVSHHRLTPKRHALRNRVYWMLLDLSELAALDAELKLFSHNRCNLFSCFDRDHGDGTDTPLLEQARTLIASAGIDAREPTIQMLCMPRVAGYDFNPLTVYYCSNERKEVIAVIYEVNNTFGGRHSYVIPTTPSKDGTIRQVCDKAFYVSPFMDLDMKYRFRTKSPNQKVGVSVQARKHDRAVINTSLIGHRRELSDRNLFQVAITHPGLPMKVTGAIYWNALKLWCRGFAVNPAKPSTAITATLVRPNE